jgi:phosphinothricin acetyltransferase
VALGPLGARIVLVAEDDDATVAGCGVSPYRERAYSTTVGLGLPRRPPGRVWGGCCSMRWSTPPGHGFHAVMARIVADHDASIALHAVCGFEIVGHEREVGRKFGRWLDVTLMERLL